ncbi:MAG: acetyl-CoA carboxylase carboxyl transferase subunit alpha, partial [Pseudomonadota bacterium]|nr:acetyl-CoA carboxylase carboxyl transferase subunit alpha [Pseudomonadota bacterium]
MQVYLEFEKPIAEMEGKIAELRAISKDDPEVNILNEVTRLEEKVVSQLEKTY